jgi:hypothetical protein
LNGVERIVWGKIYRNDVIELGIFDIRMIVIGHYGLFERLVGVKVKLDLVYSAKVGDFCVFWGPLAPAENVLFFLR